MERIIEAADINPVFTMEEWLARTAQHAVIDFTAEETKLDLQGKEQREFFLVVIGTTTDPAPRRITLGWASLTMHDDGDDELDTNPALGSSLIPVGSVYDGDGEFVLAVTANKTYGYAMGANEISLANGTEELTEAGNFVAQGATVTLTGTPNELVTATVRTPVYLTADEARQLFQSKQPTFYVSPNKRWILKKGIDDNGVPYEQPIDTQA